jgi:hypothetical protein
VLPWRPWPYLPCFPVSFCCCLQVHPFSLEAQTTMSSHAQYYTVSGDEYLFDMRLRQPCSASQAQELEHELNRLSQESQPSRPRSDSSSDDISSPDERMLPSYAGGTKSSFSKMNRSSTKSTSSRSTLPRTRINNRHHPPTLVIARDTIKAAPTPQGRPQSNATANSAHYHLLRCSTAG